MATLWFCFAAMVIAGYVVLDGFDMGAGIVQLFVARSESEKRQVLRSIGPVWDGNEVWLLATGGVLFCAFPSLYASSFSGFYLPLMNVLWLLILRGASIELSAHAEGPLWKPLWNTIFGGASALLALVFGVALGNVVRGVPLDSSGYFFLPMWTNLMVGPRTGIVDWFTLLFGFASLLALAVHGSLWVVMKTTGNLQARTRTFNARCWVGVVAITLLVDVISFSIQPHLKMQFQAHPWGIVFPVIAAAGLFGARIFSAREKDAQAFIASSVFLIGMLVSVAFGVFPNLLPSNTSPDLSLTIFNAATSEHGLRTALVWFLPGMALTITYTVLVYRHFSGKVV
ncbi:MAG: cytochrome d ubiquinol oxidase, subunit [Chthonomonadaceae bacterium]|nr:cytochrome d ubiquinol oxidase, subunit [Chthonomonadaceae bacterium]